ncbi:MAG TPA: hypothetical protein VFL60_07295 [Gaiellaceae bacterium]|nr:hypothetical protein [Gaiellaceae bacterium]
MTELERALARLDVEWPATPAFDLRRPARRQAWLLALAAAAVAVGVAFAVPQSRAALLRVLHLGGVTIERVRTLPPAQERALASTLGTPVGPAEAEALLGRPFGVDAKLYRSGALVSALLPGPVVLTELRTGIGPAVLKKVVATSTDVRPVRVRGAPGVWIAGEQHAVFAPPLPPRLAGNVLVWVRGPITYRLEGKELTLERAQQLAAGVRDR